MRCSRCGRGFEGGERRFGFKVGWVCWDCVRELMRKPVGMCYGETDDGMWRWLRECAEAERLRRRAEEIELYHRQMAVFGAVVMRRDDGGEECSVGGGGEG